MTIENDIRLSRLDKTKEVATNANEELDWPNLNKYREDNEKLAVIENKGDRIVLIGDSITEGWSNFDPEFFTRNNLINRGISGQTSPQMLIRFKQDAIHLNPKLIVVNAGTNDIAANTGPSSPEMIIDNITSMAEIAMKNSINVALSTILPVEKYEWNKNVDDAPARISKVNAALKDYCASNNLVFINYFAAMVNDRKGLKSAYGNDGVHPTQEGYDVMASVLKNTISGLI